MLSWETVEKTYTDAIQAAFPFQRVIIFLFGILISLSIKSPTQPSIIGTIVHTNLDNFLSLSDLVKELYIHDIIIGLILVVFGSLFSKTTLRTFLFLAARSTKLWEKISPSQPQFSFPSTLKISERKEAVEWIESITNGAKLKIKNLNLNSEISAGIGFGFCISFYFGNFVDISLGILLLIFSLCLSLRSISIFISEYLGPQSIKSMLETGEIKKEI